MGKIEKLKKRLLQRPRDFSYAELLVILKHIGYTEIKGGKTAGSRRAFVHQVSKHVIRLHRPHPGNILKLYQVNEIIDELTKYGYL